MKKKLLLFLFSIIAVSTMNAQEIVKLWNENPPTDNGITGTEVDENNRISNVSAPEMFIYKPNLAIDRNIAVVICPGGGYSRAGYRSRGL